MCCRYYYEDVERELRKLLRDEKITASLRLLSEKTADRDVFPSQPSLTIHSDGCGLTMSEMMWGISNPYSSGLIINARAETVREKRLFADSIAARRCVIPASGFYEWDPYKARFRFTPPDEKILLLAGFYREEQRIKRDSGLRRRMKKYCCSRGSTVKNRGRQDIRSLPRRQMTQ